jgi:hypothetical protein
MGGGGGRLVILLADQNFLESFPLQLETALLLSESNMAA